MNIKTIINNQGKIIEIGVIKNDDGSLIDYELKEGEQAVDYLNDCQTVTNGVCHSPLKPKWNGTKWVELASDEELQMAYPPLPTPLPTQLDKVEAQITYTAMMTDTTILEG